jgi:ABC-type sugar transport system substrate-binding protein
MTLPWKLKLHSLLLLLLTCSKHVSIATAFTFALVPKSVDNPFFDVARDGCMDQAALLGVTCLYTGPPSGYKDTGGALQAQMITDLIESRLIDGLAISVQDIESITPVIQKAVAAGIPVITFDSDAPNSARAAYIGTNNFFFGIQLAKVLKQLVPTGGLYGTVGSTSSNIMERVRGFEYEIAQNGLWTPVQGSPSDHQRNFSLAVDQMNEFARLNATGIVPTMGGPMRSGRWVEFVDQNRDNNVTLVSGDAMPNQLAFLDRGYVAGLVGQLPYEMGFMSIQVLYDLIQGKTPNQEVIGTNVLTHLKVPLILPELTVNNNLIGNLNVVGFTLFAMVAFTALGFAVWIYRSRNVRVVKVSQPMFLIMVAVGVLVMAASLIPLSFDDSGEVGQNYHERALMCMSIPWLGFCGFTITFSALVSKTMRINMIFRSKVPFGRIKVTMRDVMAPFFVLVTVNIVVLLCWTLIDPLVYVREANPGTDGWNRIISTYGSCQSDNSVRYLVPLAVVNISVLVAANWQAYVSRVIESEFAESKYIAMTMASLLQASLTGLPVLFVVRDSPQAFYLVAVFMIFVICMAILLLIFVPKIILADAFKRRSEQEQRQLIFYSIRRSSTRSLRADRPNTPAVHRVSSSTFSVPDDRVPSAMLRAAANNDHELISLEENEADSDLSLDGDDNRGMKVVRTDAYSLQSTQPSTVDDECALKTSPTIDGDNKDAEEDAIAPTDLTHSGGEEDTRSTDVTASPEALD